MTSVYKRDRKVIANVIGINAHFKLIYYIISIVAAASAAVAVIIKGKTAEDILPVVWVLLWAPFTGFGLKTLGLRSPNAKGIDEAREMFKGDTVLSDTLCCIPIRRESVYRFIMDCWLELAAVVFTVFACLTAAFAGDGRLWIILFPLEGLYLFFTFITFFDNFVDTVKSKRARIIIKAGNLAFLVTIFILVIACCVGAPVMNMLECSPLDGISADNAPPIGLAVITLILWVLYAFAMEVVFRRKVLTERKVSWYD